MRDRFIARTVGFAKIAIAVASVNLIAAGGAHAYIDPGTAGMAVQALLAVIAAGAATVAVFWQQVRARIGQLFGRAPGRKKDEGLNE